MTTTAAIAGVITVAMTVMIIVAVGMLMAIARTSITTVTGKHSKLNVGAGLPAIAQCHQPIDGLTLRYRGQARLPH